MDWVKRREQMVKIQLIARGIRDPKVLSAMGKVPRHEFLPVQYKDMAYVDSAFAIGKGQTISQPYMVAKMTECLELGGDEKVLEIGTGSGYQAAILAQLSQEVYSIERIQDLADSASDTLKKLGYSNVKIFVGDGTEGLKEYSPYDRIIVTAGATDIPPALIEQLKDGGMLVIPIGQRFSQILTTISQIGGKITKQESVGCVFVELVGRYGW